MVFNFWNYIKNPVPFLIKVLSNLLLFSWSLKVKGMEWDIEDAGSKIIMEILTATSPWVRPVSPGWMVWGRGISSKKSMKSREGECDNLKNTKDMIIIQELICSMEVLFFYPIRPDVCSKCVCLDRGQDLLYMGDLLPFRDISPLGCLDYTAERTGDNGGNWWDRHNAKCGVQDDLNQINCQLEQ